MGRISLEVQTMRFALATVLAALLTLSATEPSSAGGMSEPVMAPEVIVEETSSSNGGILVPLLFLAIVVATKG